MKKPAEHGRSPTVLVVDDDPMTRMLAQKSLSNKDFTVCEAEDGIQALALFPEARPDIVLLDVEMPNLDGFSTCAELRKLPAGKNLPVLMVTGLEDESSIDRAYDAGATDFATKPINWSLLGRRIRYMLRASQAFNEVQESRARLAEAQRLAKLGNWEWDLENDRMQWSDEVYRIYGVHPGANDLSHETLLLRIPTAERAVVEKAIQIAIKKGKPFSIDHHILLPGRTQRIVHTQGSVSFGKNDRPVLLTGTVQDITTRKEAEKEIHHLAYYDSLTGLPNRESFKDRIGQALNLAKHDGRRVATMFLDLDDFKRINDTLGHTMGDRLLVAVGDRLRSSVRDSDCTAHNNVIDQKRDETYRGGNVARLGGDEFTIFLSEIHRMEDAAIVARRILKALSQPVVLSDQEIFITPSIGIAVFPDDGEEVDSLLMNADTAMYHAKKAGKNTYRFYTQSMNTHALERLGLEGKLRKALSNDEFSLHYQPQVDARSGELVAMEALLRWHNPEIGDVSPADFIPLAEDTGTIVEIGEWVLNSACSQNKAWQLAGLKPLRVGVNLSAVQFRQQDLVAILRRTLVETGLAPEYLDLELTESIIMHNVEETITALNRLQSMGLQLSVDDFGTGYSSLSYLKRFPLNALKIDRSFIQDVPDDPDDTAITKAIIAMAHGLNLRVIAEGVETERQLAYLRKQGCDEIQGFLFGKPLPAENFTRLLEDATGQTGSR